MSLPEVLLWTELRKRPGGRKFRKQFPKAGHCVDFACVAARLGIEVDGEVHNRGDQPEFDVRRDEELRRAGLTIQRVPARDVLKKMEAVITMIVARCDELGPLHHPAAPGGPPPRAGEDLQ